MSYSAGQTCQISFHYEPFENHKTYRMFYGWPSVAMATHDASARAELVVAKMASKMTQDVKTAHNLADKQRTEDIELRTNRDIDFPGLLLSPAVLLGLGNAGFVRPSPIQLEAIPIGRCGADLIVQAKSGTGKTCVFAVVALESIKADNRNVQILVLAPTREIVVQVHEVVSSLASAMPHFKCEYFIGGTPYAEDKVKIKNCQMAIGTPGRIQQLIQENVLKTGAIRLFVLDEADKLLEESFQASINWIYHKLPSSKQMLALSATYPESLAQLLAKYMQTPTFVRMSEKNPALIGVKQFYKITEFHPVQAKAFENKVVHVLNVLSSLPFGQCIIFSNNQMTAQALCDRLDVRGWPAMYISGKKEQAERLRAISSLREFKCRVLVSTDLTARGIDVENVNLVLNLDVPRDLETYLHRIGRAGRFGSHGIAITLASDGDEEKHLMNMKREGKLSLALLPEKLGQDLWETMMLADAVKPAGEDAGTEDQVPDCDAVTGTEEVSSVDEASQKTSSKPDLPMSAMWAEMSKFDMNAELEMMGILRPRDRVVHPSNYNRSYRPPADQPDPLRSPLCAQMSKLEVSGESSAEAVPEITEVTIEADEKSLREFLAASGEACNVCGVPVVATTSSSVTPEPDLHDLSGIHEILHRSHRKLLLDARNGHDDNDGFLEMLSQILGCPLENPAANDEFQIPSLPSESCSHSHADQLANDAVVAIEEEMGNDHPGRPMSGTLNSSSGHKHRRAWTHARNHRQRKEVDETAEEPLEEETPADHPDRSLSGTLNSSSGHKHRRARTHARNHLRRKDVDETAEEPLEEETPADHPGWSMSVTLNWSSSHKRHRHRRRNYSRNDRQRKDVDETAEDPLEEEPPTDHPGWSMPGAGLPNLSSDYQGHQQYHPFGYQEWHATKYAVWFSEYCRSMYAYNKHVRARVAAHL